MNDEELAWFRGGNNIQIFLLNDPDLPIIIEEVGIENILDTFIDLSKDERMYNASPFFQKLMVAAVKLCYEAPWDEVVETMKHKTRDYKSAKDSIGVEYSAFMAAIAHICQLDVSPEEKQRLCEQLKDKWGVITHFLCVTLNMRVRCRYDNIFQVVPLFSDTHSDRSGYSHLMMRCLARNSSVLYAEECGKRKKRITALEKLLKVNKNTVPNHELDRLFEVIFPNIETDDGTVLMELHWLLENLRSEYAEKRKRGEEIYLELKKQGNLKLALELLAKWKDGTADSVPIEVLASAILKNDYSTARTIFLFLGDGLDKEPAWMKATPYIKEQLELKKEEEEQRVRMLGMVAQMMTNNVAMPITVNGDYVAGDKHVENEVDKVMPGAIGIKKEIKRDNEQR